MDKSVVNNVADEKQIKASKILKELADRQVLEDIQHVISTEAGRRFIWKKIEACQIGKSLFSESHASMCYDEGQRMFGNSLYAECKQADLGLFRKMEDENLVTEKETNNG